MEGGTIGSHFPGFGPGSALDPPQAQAQTADDRDSLEPVGQAEDLVQENHRDWPDRHTEHDPDDDPFRPGNTLQEPEGHEDARTGEQDTPNRHGHGEPMEKITDDAIRKTIETTIIETFDAMMSMSLLSRSSRTAVTT